MAIKYLSRHTLRYARMPPLIRHTGHAAAAASRDRADTPLLIFRSQRKLRHMILPLPVHTMFRDAIIITLIALYCRDYAIAAAFFHADAATTTPLLPALPCRYR